VCGRVESGVQKWTWKPHSLRDSILHVMKDHHVHGRITGNNNKYIIVDEPSLASGTVREHVYYDDAAWRVMCRMVVGCQIGRMNMHGLEPVSSYFMWEHTGLMVDGGLTEAADTSIWKEIWCSNNDSRLSNMKSLGFGKVTLGARYESALIARWRLLSIATFGKQVILYRHLKSNGT